jgi:hypothetical protein
MCMCMCMCMCMGTCSYAYKCVCIVHACGICMNLGMFTYIQVLNHMRVCNVRVCDEFVVWVHSPSLHGGFETLLCNILTCKHAHIHTYTHRPYIQHTRIHAYTHTLMHADVDNTCRPRNKRSKKKSKTRTFVHTCMQTHWETYSHARIHTTPHM